MTYMYSKYKYKEILTKQKISIHIIVMSNMYHSDLSSFVSDCTVISIFVL